MTPYYADESVTLYHGDCLKVTAWLEADVLVTDPPYGMAYRGFGGRPGMNDATKHKAIEGDGTTEIRDAALTMWGDRPALVFGTWRVERPSGTRQLIVWDKSANGPGMGALDLPWGPSHEEVYVLGRGFHGKREGSVYGIRPFTSQDAIRPDHPTPKPTALMEALLAKCPAGVVADPFAGSGATLVAAALTGRKAIGVELEERYCEVIAKRLAQGVLDFGEASA
jgi:site-specific DNA-methyltransferase (adenine-specific)